MLTKKFTQRMMAVSAVLVILIGLGMSSNGLNLAGVATPSFIGDDNKATTATESTSTTSGAKATTADTKGNVQVVTVKVTPNGYAPVSVKVGVPVKLIFHVEPGSLTSCNRRVLIPKYGIDLTLKEGDNAVEFTPKETGTVSYSCWMGMIHSTITTK